jgi:hypothetical protein
MVPAKMRIMLDVLGRETVAPGQKKRHFLRALTRFRVLLYCNHLPCSYLRIRQLLHKKMKIKVDFLAARR